jgi:hypothetical protein
MADKNSTWGDRLQKVADSPVGKRVVRGIELASAAGTERELVERARKAWNGRKKESRSSSR